MTRPSPNQTLLLAFIVILACLNITGCARRRSNDSAQSTATSAKVTANDLNKLHWIEGT